MLAEDVAILKRFYINRGFPDVRVSYSDPLSPNDKEAAVVFIIDEGRHYSIGGISAEFITSDNLKPVFTQEQIRGLIAMKEGDVFRKSDVAEAVSAINNAYGVLGRINDEDPRQRAVTNARLKMYGGSSSIALDVATATPYHANPGTTVDILFTIVEGVPTRVGVVKINGNTVTNDSVIRRSIGLRPGYPFDSEEAILSEERLNKTGLFNKVTMAIQEKDPNNPGTRDLLVDVDESQTGSINFGLSAGSDSGLLGNISLRQRNFDVADFPESWSEFIQNKSFRGAGQQFHMAFQPGDEMFNYEIGLTDPRFLDTDYSLGGTAGWNMREYRRSGHYTQETLFSRVTLGRRFGDIWIGNISIAADRIKLTDINRDVPLEIYNDRGPSSVNSIGISATRSTLHPFFRPTEGSRIRMSINQFGLPSGDYTFSKAYLTYTNYFAVERDFLGLTSTLRLDARLGYIFGGESPTFERFYLGGRSMRGFEFRTISPKGTPRFSGGNPDIPIGGDYEIFLGAQYEFPLLDKISLVAFIDSGTVADDLGFDDYRASFGAGIRLHIKELGQAPLAFDFAFPIVKQESDKKRMFSFSVQLPF